MKQINVTTLAVTGTAAVASRRPRVAGVLLRDCAAILDGDTGADVAFPTLCEIPT